LKAVDISINQMKLQKKVDHGNFVRKQNRSLHKTHFFMTTEAVLNSHASCRRSARPTHLFTLNIHSTSRKNRPVEGYVSRECI